MQTRQQALINSSQRFREAGIPSAALDARLLLCLVCGLTYEEYLRTPDIHLDSQETKRLASYTNRRLSGEPVSRITGSRAFWKYDFQLSRETLDPRPESEILIEAALTIAAHEGWHDQALEIADLGTGSGCLLLSLLGEFPKAMGTGYDVSDGALQTAKLNASHLGFQNRSRFITSNWLDAADQKFHMIVANPPYIPTSHIARLEKDVALFDPFCALDGGAEGLSAYQAIIPSLAPALMPGGWVLFEVGDGQHDEIKKQLAAQNFDLNDAQLSSWKDLRGCMRVVAAKALM